MSQAVPNRWTVALAGIAMQLMLGTVYAWSVFKTPLMKAHNWTGPQVGMAFTIVIFCIGFAAAFGGKFVDKAGAKKVATLAAILFGVGTLLAGVAEKMGSLWGIYLTYGLIAGVGNGLGYVTPIAVLVRWFPDKRGLITGLAVMGFGLGAAIMGQIAPLTIVSLGLGKTFLLFGALFLVVLLPAAQKLVNPPEGWTPPAPVKAAKTAPVVVTPVDLKGALGMYQFYILWGILCINVTAGIALLSNLSPMAQQQAGVTPAVAGTIIFIGSLFNGLGRIFWASLSDKLGRKNVFLLILATQIPVFIFLPQVTNPVLFTVMCCYILLCYGGGFATMPAFAADTFSAKNMGQIYGKILLAWSAAGVIGPMLMEYIKTKSGNFTVALLVAAGMLGLGFILTLAYKKPVSKAAVA
ncbi:MAG: OFA family MFS transporter [Chitinispirillaceae bacterium]|nr:OFA family MFS transporter [Chitinispirillaceae bacterium]